MQHQVHAAMNAETHNVSTFNHEKLDLLPQLPWVL